MMEWLKARKADLEGMAGRYRDKEAAEAIVAIMCGVAYADEGASSAEKGKFAAATKVNPILKQYDASMLLKKWADLAEQCEFDIPTGLDACLKELADICHIPIEKRITVLKLGIAAARSDGETSPLERDYLCRCADVLDVPAAEIGL
jgi:tellurite resistance protein